MVSTTIAAGSNGVSLPTGTINVASTTNFAASGTILVTTSTGNHVVTYTGKSATSFTGCTGGTGTMTTGNQVSFSVGQLSLSNINIFDTPGYTSGADHWDGQTCILPLQFTDGAYQGGFLSFGGFNEQSAVNLFSNLPYSGYTSNFGGINIENNIVNASSNLSYIGYTTNYGATAQSTDNVLTDTDLNSIINHPKDQFLYYKLKGYNNLTSSYESWVVKENITGRPELFDNGNDINPPNIERDIYFSSPSGNTLSNIVIVARWIE